MIKITVNASRHYEVLVGDVAEELKKLPKTVKYALICDSNAYAFHGNYLKSILKEHTFSLYVFPSGEKNKNINEYYKIINFLADNGFDRNDCVIGFGGGVVGDVAGFASATYMRGIGYVAVPTTLLAMTDSSVGGKTAVNIPAGKNLLGTFRQPDAVFCHLPFLETLPDDVFSDGMAEVIKYGVIRDRDLFFGLSEGCGDMESVISRCIEIKRDTVEKDETDRGERMILNFGHTAAHAIEKLSDNGISHGSAVAMGMVIAAKYAEKNGICPAGTVTEIENLLQKYGHTKKCPYPAEELYIAALHDKKKSGDEIKVVLPTCIGDCCIKTFTLRSLSEFFAKENQNESHR